MTLLSLLCSQPTQSSSMDQHFPPVLESAFIQSNQPIARPLPLTKSSKAGKAKMTKKFTPAKMKPAAAAAKKKTGAPRTKKSGPPA